MKTIPPLPAPKTASDWIAEEARVREQFLNDIVFHGWPRQWINSPPVFRPMGDIETDGSYRLRKFQYEIVPGFWSTALLYKPARIDGTIPAILHLDGHFREGKAAEFVQKLCINFAKRGMLVLALEWFGFGELSEPEDAHDYGAHLDLVGANALGLFYLAMRRGLDYLAILPEVDSRRLGATGLSGGGWQTVVLAALDTRTDVAVEDAGVEALQTAITHPLDNDEVELDATDLCKGQDYPDLIAIRAPRPTLLIHNVADEVYRSALVKPQIYDEIKTFFKLFGDGDAFDWHENVDPGTHNDQLDNRQQTYAFFTRHFNMPVTEEEIPSGSEIKSIDELRVGVSSDNLTVLGVARELASKIVRPPIPNAQLERAGSASEERGRLKSVIRYKPVEVEDAWRMWSIRGTGVESIFYRFDFDNQLSATGVWMRAIDAPAVAPAVIVLNDSGRKQAGPVVSDLINRSEQVLSLDLIFNGEMRPQKPDPTDYELTVATTGARPLGLEVAQLIGAANWLMRAASGHGKVRLETTGIRSQVVALTAAALEPSLFSEIVTHGGMRSLAYLLGAPVPFRSAPELFCLDFYKYFDLDRLVALAGPTEIRQTESLDWTKR
jgi:dienelactone hydrolase